MTPPNARSLLRILRITDEGDEGMQLVITLPNGDSAWMGCYEPDSIAANVLLGLRAFLAAEPQQDNDQRGCLSGAETPTPAIVHPGGRSRNDAGTGLEPLGHSIQAGEVAALIERLRELDRSDACLKGTQMIPLHRETVRNIRVMLARLSAERDAAYERCASECEAMLAPEIIVGEGPFTAATVMKYACANTIRALTAPANEGAKQNQS